MKQELWTQIINDQKEKGVDASLQMEDGPIAKEKRALYLVCRQRTYFAVVSTEELRLS